MAKKKSITKKALYPNKKKMYGGGISIGATAGGRDYNKGEKIKRFEQSNLRPGMAGYDEEVARRSTAQTSPERLALQQRMAKADALDNREGKLAAANSGAGTPGFVAMGENTIKNQGIAKGVQARELAKDTNEYGIQEAAITPEGLEHISKMQREGKTGYRNGVKKKYNFGAVMGAAGSLAGMIGGASGDEEVAKTMGTVADVAGTAGTIGNAAADAKANDTNGFGGKKRVAKKGMKMYKKGKK